MRLTVKLANVEVTLGLFDTVEESLRLTAADGTDSKGNEVWAMMVREKKESGTLDIYPKFLGRPEFGRIHYLEKGSSVSRV